LAFDEAAATAFSRLRCGRLQIVTMDLKRAAIVLSRDATLLSRHLIDFSHMPNLHVEDWTAFR
jgi:tRNA(fMet)-specific endonuclease VapC